MKQRQREPHKIGRIIGCAGCEDVVMKTEIDDGNDEDDNDD